MSSDDRNRIPPRRPAPEEAAARRRQAAGRRQTVRRRRGAAAALAAAILALATVAALGYGGHPSRALRPVAPSSAPPRSRAPTPAFAVGLRVLTLVDRSRQIQLPGGGSASRALVTYVRYPAIGPTSGRDRPGAPPAPGPFPLVVFGHGFALTPGLYARLLDAWAAAGYVVAAPVFPLENAHAPGGPDESDLTNQPRDMRFVISALLAERARSPAPLGHLVDSGEIAVAGHSDGGDAALAVASDRRYRDNRVRAAAILSGAEIPTPGSLTPVSGAPPLLAVQGMSDTVNPPNMTLAFFRLARRPKYLLRLFGAGHIPPYSAQQPQLGIVERTTIAFFDRYLKGTAAGAGHLAAWASRVAALTAQP